MSRDQQFYLLTLSRKHVRLFLCTWRTAKEIPIGALAPQSLEVWLNSRMPDHLLDNRASAGPSVGAMNGVMFGTSSDSDRHDEYLAHFFKKVDKGLHKVLSVQNFPLLLAGVESEIAIYRQINTYPHLLEPAVHGSPDGLPNRDLHSRAVEAVKRTFSARLGTVLLDFKEVHDAKRVSFSIPEILKQAKEGRVADLLIREDAEYPGASDGDQNEDLLNLAAVQTLSHRGQAFELKASEMPHETDVAALLRF
jgi:hypothetical protein